MATSRKVVGLGAELINELPIAKQCVAELIETRNEIRSKHRAPREFFDFGWDINFESERTPEKQLETLTRACVWHAIALKTEFTFKLLYSIDGYLSAVESKNPISTYLLGRYLLELVATIGHIDSELNEHIKVDLTSWQQRGRLFFATLFKARHSTSDKRFELALTDFGVPRETLRPIKIGKAISALSNRSGFSSAPTLYAMLSNLCHHNGSGHKILVESMMETNSITTAKGIVALKSQIATAKMSYPSQNSASAALAHTARVAWWSAICANRIILGLAETPFTDKELRHLTNGRLRSIRPADSFFGSQSKLWAGTPYKVGRNDPCVCGSGKKFKVACTRFRRHQVWCDNGTGGGSWSVGSLRGSSSLRLCA